MEKTGRKLAAILAADIVGSSRLIEADESYALAAIHQVISAILPRIASSHGGRVIKTMGDGALIEFASSVAAVKCAEEVQQVIRRSAEAEPPERRILLRIGINLGDVIFQADGELYGDGVNVAARLESIAPPGGIAISGNVHDELQGKLSLPFLNAGEQALKNISRPVRVFTMGGSTVRDQSSFGMGGHIAVSATLTVPNRPSIAVLPFGNLSSDPEQDYFADGVVEDIITALSREPTFFVIARNSSFAFKGRAVDVRQVGRELGVRYVLEGSIRKAESRVRITCQLIEAETGRHVWADKFDGTVEDVFDLQDQITQRVVTAVGLKLQKIESDRATLKRPEDLSAYDMLLRALPHMWSLSLKSMYTALDLLEQAVERDAGLAYAYALAGYCLMFGRNMLWPDLRPDQLELGLAYARRAVSIDPHDPRVLWTAAAALANMGRELGHATDLLERSLYLDSNSAMAWSTRGWVASWAGEPEFGIEAQHRAIRLSPLDPFSFIFWAGLGEASVYLGRDADGVEQIERAMRLNPNYISSQRALAVGYARLGRQKEAEEIGRRILAIDASFSLGRWRNLTPIRPGPVQEAMVAGLRLAGLPD